MNIGWGNVFLWIVIGWELKLGLRFFGNFGCNCKYIIIINIFSLVKIINNNCVIY